MHNVRFFILKREPGKFVANQEHNIFAMVWRMVMVVILLSSVSTATSAQSFIPFLRSTFLNQNVYKTKKEISLIQVYDLESKTAFKEPTIYKLDLKDVDYIRYRIVKDGDKPYIRVLPHVESEQMGYAVHIRVTGKNDPDLATKTSPTRFIFQMQEPPDANAKYLATERLTGLPITMPVKFRKLNGKVQTSLNAVIGYAFGWKIRVNNNPYKENYINVIPYAFSLSIDKHFERNSDGTFTESKDSFALNYWTWGIAYQFQKTNVGLFMGWDRMFNDNKDWIYQKKSWLSLGLGYKIGG